MVTGAARIRTERVLGIVRASDAKSAVAVGEAILRSGIGCLEVALTSPGGLEAIRELVARHGSDASIGAGTVTDARLAVGAIESGAAFVVSPATIEEVIAAARSARVSVIPGAATATELMHALELGADLVKLFPAAQLGGPNFVRALRQPFPDAPLVPTGGVTLADAPRYLAAGAVAVAIGGDLTGAEPDEVEQRGRTLLAALQRGPR